MLYVLDQCKHSSPGPASPSGNIGSAACGSLRIPENQGHLISITSSASHNSNQSTEHMVPAVQRFVSCHPRCQHVIKHLRWVLAGSRVCHMLIGRQEADHTAAVRIVDVLQACRRDMALWCLASKPAHYIGMRPVLTTSAKLPLVSCSVYNMLL